MRILSRLIILCLSVSIFFQLGGCAALKKKFTPKKKDEPQVIAQYQLREYNIKPSLELYEKHYVFWINWQRKLIDELGRNSKNDTRCAREITGNLEDMATLLVDEKAAELRPHIEDLNKVRTMIENRNMTVVNQTRVRRILEREYRIVKREFSPTKMKDFIREEWK